MKLSEHVDAIRQRIEAAFDKQFARLGIGSSKLMGADKLPELLRAKRPRLEEMLESHIGETGSYEAAREKLIDELTFTLFNRLAAIKVMESASLFPPILDKKAEHGGRSFGHKAWLELRPDMREEELEGIREYLKHAFDELGSTLPLYSRAYPYALLPDPISLNEIIDAFNAVESDSQVEDDIWQSDDVLGWTYESYNNQKKQAHKDSKKKTEYHKVSLQSQVYTPRWVVQFLVNNSLGKLYLEMFPDSEIRHRYKIANAPETQERERKPLHEIKLIDPACGSGNFLLYSFDFFHDLYLDQIENYGADYEERDIPKLIIANNLHGIDLDDRAIQLAQLGLFIKAKKKNRSVTALKFRVVSSDFYLPDYADVSHIFEDGSTLNKNQKDLIESVWTDLQYAYKFGSLIRLDERVKAKMRKLIEKRGNAPSSLFSNEDLELDPQMVQDDIFTEHDIKREEQFISSFFAQLKQTVQQYAQASETNTDTFLSSKTRDAITFLELLTTKYDVATANPPYTDSSDFGPELKSFIEANYKKPHKFHTNLYATFIKRCFELTTDKGKVAMIHPRTFMFIKTFEGVRKFILENTHINTFVDYSLSNLFGSIMVDPAFYVLEKGASGDQPAWFVSLDQYTRTPKEKLKKDFCLQSLVDYINKEENEHNHTLPQSKLKIIKSWPFIYWISDEFREKFEDCSIEDAAMVVSGVKTGNNDRLLRYWWEVDATDISESYQQDKKPWVPYSKGGDFNKWFGNIWLCVNYRNDGQEIKKSNNYNLLAPNKSFKRGITYSATSTKGVSFRLLEENCLFDMKGSSIIFQDETKTEYALAVLNSKLSTYIAKCLNGTVETQVGDIKRIPYTEKDTSKIEELSIDNIKIKELLLRCKLVENSFRASPLELSNKNSDHKTIIFSHLTYENYLLTQTLIKEASINEKVFEVYALTESDKAMVLAKEGESIGAFPVLDEARKAYLAEDEATKEFPLDNIQDFIAALPAKDFAEEEVETITAGFSSLYQSNNDLEEFCIKHQVNPINVWYWFKQNQIIPQQRMHTLAMEFLVDMVREILMEDEDGIIPLVPNAGETVLLDRIEEKFREKGFTRAQYSSFDSVLGRPLPDYLNKRFFEALSDHLNLFMYLPKTPFIWHLSSGPEQGFDCYIIIYKWSKDKLLKIRSQYIENRERSLINRQSDLATNESADAQNEKDRIYKQLQEIEAYKAKIDELLAEGYDPILDDGVGKNIAPLQKKGMIPYDVLNAGQLKKYLNADW
jgi:hypothetical protein